MPFIYVYTVQKEIMGFQGSGPQNLHSWAVPTLSSRHKTNLNSKLVIKYLLYILWSLYKYYWGSFYKEYEKTQQIWLLLFFFISWKNIQNYWGKKKSQEGGAWRRRQQKAADWFLFLSAAPDWRRQTRGRHWKLTAELGTFGISEFFQ